MWHHRAFQNHNFLFLLLLPDGLEDVAVVHDPDEAVVDVANVAVESEAVDAKGVWGPHPFLIARQNDFFADASLREL